MVRRLRLSPIESPLRRVFFWSQKKLVAALPDLLFFGGLLTVAVGIGLVFVPAGVIAAGAALSGCVYLAARR